MKAFMIQSTKRVAAALGMASLVALFAMRDGRGDAYKDGLDG